MADTIRSRTELKAFFETGDIPTQSEFDDLITSAAMRNPTTGLVPSSEVDLLLENLAELTAVDGVFGRSCRVPRFHIDLDRDAELQVANVPATGAVRTLRRVKQDETGDWELTWPAGIKWSGGVEPTWTTDPRHCRKSYS